MSVKVETEIARPGDDSYVEAAWRLKERIRREEDVLKQRRGFFEDAYRRSTVYLLVSSEGENPRLMGFAAVRRDGYILFLAVSPDFRGSGVGKRLVGRVVENYDSVTCHARATNEQAMGFYEHLGFEIERRIDNYYEDGGDAFYLRLGEDGGLGKKLSEFVRG